MPISFCPADNINNISDGRRDAYKERWYSTLGKRTYNAIAETVKNAGFEI